MLGIIAKIFVFERGSSLNHVATKGGRGGYENDHDCPRGGEGGFVECPRVFFRRRRGLLKWPHSFCPPFKNFFLVNKGLCTLYLPSFYL